MKNLKKLEKNVKRDLKQIDQAFQDGDIDAYVEGCNDITENFGKRPLFENMTEFDALMNSDEPISF